jgi:hypothetical protein
MYFPSIHEAPTAHELYNQTLFMEPSGGASTVKESCIVLRKQERSLGRAPPALEGVPHLEKHWLTAQPPPLLLGSMAMISTWHVAN